MIALRAPAKLNLSLRVLGKRPDGYHEIETLFERIDLADGLIVEEDPQALRLTCTEPTLSCGEDNLILRAARLLRQAAGSSRGARIHLVKRIPIASGLGGGSSDAAAALTGLNRLWKLGLRTEQLSALGAQVGSDVPFFFEEAPFAIGRGRGERCEPLETATRLSHVLVIPDVRLSTREVYEGARFGPVASAPNDFARRAGGLGLTAPRTSITMIAHAIRNGSLSELATGIWNDLEPEAIRRCPVIQTIQEALRLGGALAVRVSGSGPSVHGLYADHRLALQAGEECRARFPQAWRVEVARTDTQKPAAVFLD